MPLVAIFVFASCKKNTGVTNQPYDTYGTPADKGQLKINLAFAYAIDYANLRIKLNGAYVSNLLQSRTPFPGGGYNTRGSNFALYMSVPLGTNAVSIVMPRTNTNVDSVVLFTTNVNITDNTPQTLHLTDTAANMKSVLVKNNIVGIADGMCRFNFVHLMPNVPAVDGQYSLFRSFWRYGYSSRYQCAWVCFRYNHNLGYSCSRCYSYVCSAGKLC